jgi:NitT/TauT family transport system permease protein
MESRPLGGQRSGVSRKRGGTPVIGEALTMTLFGRKVPLIFSLAIWFIVWEVIGQAKLSIIIPPFSRVIAAAITILPTEKFNAAAIISLRSFGIGMALAVLIGIPVGVLMARVQGVGRILGMWVNIFVSAPISALVPLLMAVVGIGETTVVVTVFLFAVFVIILDTEVGVTNADRSLVDMARSFGARRQQLYTKVLLKSALPEILAGLRLGAIRGVKGVVIGQLLVAIIGVGELFELYSQHFLMEEFWALVVVVFLFAFAVSEAIAALERRVEYYASTR